jgi:large subunit ribosomal protein L29
MKAKEIRDLSIQEIEQRIREEEEQLSHARFQHAVATLQNPAQMREQRRLIARLKTILNEKKRSLQQDAQ